MRRISRAVLAVGLLCGVMLAGIAALKSRFIFHQRQQLAHALVEQLEHTPERTQEASLEELAKLGTASIEAMVDAAASPRADLALAARRMVEEKLARWQNLAVTDSQFDLETRLQELAHALVLRVDDLGPVGRLWARGIVLVVVDLAGDLPAETATPLLADCSAVLEGIPAVGSRKRTPTHNFDVVRPTPKLTEFQPDYRSLAIPSESVLGGDFDKPDDVEAHGALPAPIPTETSERLPEPLPQSPSAWVPNWGSGNQGPTTPEKLSPDDLANPGRLDVEEAHQPRQEKFVDVPSPTEMEARIRELRKLSTWNLFEAYRNAQSFEKSMLASVLGSRGFEPVELALGARLVSPEPEQRLTLVDDLKGLPAKMARKWLRELLQDPNGDVRFQALSAMATTTDPQLVTWARELAAKDTDPRVAALAARLVSETR